jgi:hypothetical protein
MADVIPLYSEEGRQPCRVVLPGDVANLVFQMQRPLEECRAVAGGLLALLRDGEGHDDSPRAVTLRYLCADLENRLVLIEHEYENGLFMHAVSGR